jgi:hypothetical protein
MTAPIASGWSGCRVGFTPTEKRRLPTAHATTFTEELSSSQSDRGSVGLTGQTKMVAGERNQRYLQILVSRIPMIKHSLRESHSNQ